MLTDPNGMLLLVARALDSVGIRYAVGGSVASSRHGEIRATHDIDIVIEVDVRAARDLASALGPDFHVDRDAVDVAVRNGGTFTAIHLTELAKIDFFVASDEKIERLQLERREAVSLASEEPDVYFVSAEDTILVKLLWCARSGRVLERQVRDAVGVLKAKGQDLDLEYLGHAATVLGVADLLEDALDAAGMSEQD